jgi:hypothetical protein
VLGLSVGILAVGPFTFFGSIRITNQLFSKEWLRALLVLVTSALVMILISRFVKREDWRYGPATTSDKLVVGGILAAIPVGLFLLLWHIHRLPFQ